MRAAPLHISTNYDITLRFIVENLRDFLEPVDHTEDSLVTVQQPAKLRTESFGPGLYIECRAEKTSDGVPCMSCRLFAGPTPYSGPITWFVSGVSLRGDTQYFQYSLTHTFGQGLGIGWREALSKVTHWDQSDTLREENALHITATVRAREGPSLFSDKTLAVSHIMLTQSQPNDIRFVTYQARRNSGRLSGVRVLFANIEILGEVCPRLAKYAIHPHKGRYSIPELLSDGIELRGATWISDIDDGSDFEEDNTADSITSFETPDLDDERDSLYTEDPEPKDIDVAQGDYPEAASQHVSESSSPLPEGWEWSFEDVSKSSEEVDQGNVDETPHDILLPNSSSPALSMVEEDTTADQAREGDVNPAPTPELHEVHSDHEWPRPFLNASTLDLSDGMRTITVIGAASPTWEAFLFYLYTGEVAFAPLTSRGAVERRKSIAHHKDKYPRRPAPCSPKSMYHLAHQLEMKELKALALKYFESQISKENVVAELFTKFTSKYEEIQEVEVAVLREHWEELKHTEQVLDVSKKIVRGELPHVTGILAAIVPLVQLGDPS